MVRIESQRVLDALQHAPNSGVIWDSRNNGWTPHYEDAMKKVIDACAQHEICAHDPDHFLRVAHNALVLKDMFELQFPNQRFPDAYVVFPPFMHDLGYGGQVEWDGKYAHDHPKESTRIFQSIRQFLFPQWVKQNGMTTHPSLDLLDEYYPLFTDAINITMEEALDRAKALGGKKEVTWQEVFPIMIKLADAFDRYHHLRIEEVKPPRDYKENPYYGLAQLVGDYSLVYDPKSKTLKQNVRLNQPLFQAGPTGLPDWVRETRRESRVDDLALQYTGLTNAVFDRHQQYVESYRLVYDLKTQILHFIVCIKNKDGYDPFFPGGPIKSSSLFKEVCETVGDLPVQYAKLTQSILLMSEGCDK